MMHSIKKSRNLLKSFVHLFLLLIYSSITVCKADVQKLCNGVYITVSSLNDNIRKIDLNWDIQCGAFPDWVGLYDVDPFFIKTIPPIVKVFIREHPLGYYRTNISLNEINLPAGWDKKDMASTAQVPGSHCLPFWIASFKNDVLQDTNCFKIQPTWMDDKTEQLNDIPLSKLLIPGTHNSGSFYSNDSIIKDEGLHRFVLTQDNDIWTQLVFGIRYLDIRIGYYSSPGVSNSSEESRISDSFWVNHDLIRIAPLIPLLRDIKNFLKSAHKEVVIMDIHRLPIGFYTINGDILKSRHEMLVNLLHEELGDIAVDFKEIMYRQSSHNIHLLNGPRLKDIWETGKRLIICYPDKSLTSSITWLWPPLRQMWGDKQKPNDLRNYIHNVLLHPNPPTTAQGNPLWAIMAQLTPNALEILFNPSNNLRKMADLVNKNLTDWIKNDWWKKANVIATDFHLGNNLVELSINSIAFKSVYSGD